MKTPRLFVGLLLCLSLLNNGMAGSRKSTSVFLLWFRPVVCCTSCLIMKKDSSLGIGFCKKSMDKILNTGSYSCLTEASASCFRGKNHWQAIRM